MRERKNEDEDTWRLCLIECEKKDRKGYLERRRDILLLDRCRQKDSERSVERVIDRREEGKNKFLFKRKK